MDRNPLYSVILVLSLFFLTTAKPRPTTAPLILRAYDATAKLYLTNPEVDPLATANLPAGICTAWNVAKTKDGYELVTAAHCIVESDNPNIQAQFKFGVSYGNPNHGMVEILPVTVLAVGNPDDENNDVALLLVQTKEYHAVLSLGDEKLETLGDPLLDVSLPYGGAKGLSLGWVYSMNTSIKLGNDWYTPAIVALLDGTGPGSSGSAIISVNQGKVIEIMNVGNKINAVFGTTASQIHAFMVAHPIKD